MLREVISYEWFTVFMVVGLAVITTAKMLFTHRFIDFVGILGKSKYLKIYNKDQKFVDSFDTLLFINLVISLSIFAYIGFLAFEPDAQFELSLFLKFILAITALSIIKVMVERLVGSLLDLDKTIDSYLFQKTSYKNFSGLVLLVINAILLYSLTPSKIAVVLSLGLIVLINSIGFLTSFKMHQKTVLPNIFYLILYLCALEIGPYLILYKIFVEYKA